MFNLHQTLFRALYVQRGHPTDAVYIDAMAGIIDAVSGAIRV